MLSMQTRCVVAVMALALAVSVILAPGPLRAQSTNDLINRIKRLEASVNDLNRLLFAEGKKPATVITSTPVQGTALSPSAAASQETSAAARAEIRLQQLEAQMRNLTGKVEELDFNLTRLTGRIDSLVSDLDGRFSALENRSVVGAPAVAGAATATASTNAAAPPPAGAKTAGVLGYLNQDDLRKQEADRDTPRTAPASDGQVAAATPPTDASGAQTQAASATSRTGPVLPEGTATVRYQHAFGYLMRHDYDNAERAFSEFIKAHGEDPLAGNAVYWLGETYYVREKFAEAAVTFAEGYEKYPGSPKTADNLLKLGFALARLQRVEDACVALAQLRDEFPNASTTIKRRALNEGNRIGCRG